MGNVGKVYLVGAGPGDPGLLTLRGKECLERADVVVYDQLVNEDLLQFAPGAEHIFVGKKTDRHTLPQEDINRLLIEHARRGACVVRLKGGDPCVLGRGGEEGLALAAAGIAFEFVPGVTAGIAAAEYAGIPVTHRGLSGSFTLITGHDVEASTDLARSLLDGTQVFYMAVARIERIAEALVRSGRATDTPAAVIEWGTLPRQRTVCGTLADIAVRCMENRISPPAVFVAGPVVSLRDQLSWFEARPLFRLRIVLTRTRTRPSDLAGMLRDLGADVLELPTFRVEAAAEPDAFGSVRDYDWIVLTSANAVEMLFEHLEQAGSDARDLAGVRLCVTGTSTHDAVKARFLRVDALPERFDAEDVLAAMEAAGGPLHGARVLIPRSELARSSLAPALRAAGAEVREATAYRAVAADTAGAYQEQLERFGPHMLVFTSSRAVRALFDEPQRTPAEMMDEVCIASIGPVTSEALASYGLAADIEPETHDIPSLVQAIVAWAKQGGPL